MRIVALGDIHSNHVALETCLNWIYHNNIDGIDFLGDYISDFPYPQKTLELIRKAQKDYRTWFVRGNREDYMINHHKNPDNDNWLYNSQSGSLLYTYANLTDEDITFFENMPLSLDVCIENCIPFTICHAVPQSNNTLLIPNTEEAIKILGEMKNNLLICGHLHKPYIYSKDDKTIANGGSVGFPTNGQACAQFILAEYNNEKWTPSIISIPYDTELLIAEYKSSGLLTKSNIWAKSIIATLRTGRNYNDECIELVSKMCSERNKSFSDEALWVEAANLIGL